MTDGSRCVWGQDRSPEVSSPDLSPPPEPPRTPYPITPPTTISRRKYWIWTEHGGLVPYPETGKKRPRAVPSARNYLEAPTPGVGIETVAVAAPSASVAPEVTESMTTPPPTSRPALSDVGPLSLLGAAQQPRPPSPPTREPTTWTRTLFATVRRSQSDTSIAQGEPHGDER